MENLTIFLPVIKIILIIILAFAGFRIFRYFIKKSVSRYVDKIRVSGNAEFVQKRKEALYSLVFKAAKLAIIFLAILFILYELGILKTAPFAVILGFSGLAVGIGIQNLARDVLRGFFIITENNLKKGDAVSINGFHGKIHDINFRRVILELSDEKGRFCYIPIGEVDAIVTKRENY